METIYFSYDGPDAVNGTLIAFGQYFPCVAGRYEDGKVVDRLPFDIYQIPPEATLVGEPGAYGSEIKALEEQLVARSDWELGKVYFPKYSNATTMKKYDVNPYLDRCGLSWVCWLGFKNYLIHPDGLDPKTKALGNTHGCIGLTQPDTFPFLKELLLRLDQTLCLVGG